MMNFAEWIFAILIMLCAVVYLGGIIGIIFDPAPEQEEPPPSAMSRSWSSGLEKSNDG
jgi:hypothetical protein